MNPTDIAAQAELAREVFNQEYADLRQLQPHEASPAYRLPVELLRSIQDHLIETEKANASRYRKVIIAGGSKHYSSKALSDLTVTQIEQLRIGCANRG